MNHLFDSGDSVVDDALRQMARTDSDAALRAQAAFRSLSWGNGLQVVSLRALQEFLWFGLPTKWDVPAAEPHEITRALGGLFDRVELGRCALRCTGSVTAAVLEAYGRDTDEAGLAVFRHALEVGGVEPPDIPGLLSFGDILGEQESARCPRWPIIWNWR